MKSKLSPFPGTESDNCFLSTAWSRSQIQDQDENEGVLLLCGSEGGKVFVWRIRRIGKTVSGQPVTILRVGSDEEDVAAICFFNEHNLKCFVSSGQKVVLLDLSATSASNSPPVVEGEWTFNEDDINSLSLSPDDSFLAAADDTGEIKLIQLKCFVSSGQKVVLLDLSVTVSRRLPVVTGWLQELRTLASNCLTHQRKQ